MMRMRGDTLAYLSLNPHNSWEHGPHISRNSEKLNPPLRDLHKHITILLSESFMTISGYTFHKRKIKPSPTKENETEEICRTRRSNHRTPTLWRPSRHHLANGNPKLHYRIGADPSSSEIRYYHTSVQGERQGPSRRQQLQR